MELAQCFDLAAEVYHVPKKLMVVIAYVESGLNPRAKNINRNGSYDIGIMQVNSSNVPLLIKAGIIKEEGELWIPCKNVMAGGYILKGCILKHSMNWKAVDCYNKGKKAKEASRYVWKVYKTLEAVNRHLASSTSNVARDQF
ncbi:MAG: lytic transglycosylase [Acidobacteria bacterium]|jgi:soluble lytic murein transglycosylase-like protein|nr:MAG: lytic transglycosylase [Acidobacteriota bacterium]